MTPDQLREARRLVGWSRLRLAAMCGVTLQVVSTFESTGRMQRPMFTRTNPVDRLTKIRTALEAEGVVFLDGEEPGVRMRKAAAQS